ncbi:hypothetical protein GF385_00380 [Candidatus Dependentiae bacterium]|nr:hypothetical protein [Candidatus Dependentiae bacterium]
MKINKLKFKMLLIFKVLLILIFIFDSCKNNLFCVPNSQKSNYSHPFILKGYIKVPQNWKRVPEFRILFNGKQVTNDENGFYSFPLDKKINKFHFLICKNVDQVFEKINTVKNLKVNIEKPYKYFLFVKNEKENEWIQEEKDLKNKNFIVRDDCIIALINPKYIEHIEPWTVNLKGKFLNLPKVIFRGDLVENKIKREAAKSLIRSMDLLPFHEKILNEKKVFNDNREAIITQ